MTVTREFFDGYPGTDKHPPSESARTPGSICGSKIGETVSCKYDEGCLAQMAKKPADDNPYDEATEEVEYYGWLAGLTDMQEGEDAFCGVVGELSKFKQSKRVLS